MKKDLLLLFPFLFIFGYFSLVEAQTQPSPYQFTAQLQSIVERLRLIIDQVEHLQKTQKPVEKVQRPALDIDSKVSSPLPYPQSSQSVQSVKPAPVSESYLSSRNFIVLEEIYNSPQISCQLPLLEYGVKHNSVYLLQIILNKSGYYPEGLITGYYGRLTREALKRFQKSQGLVVTGQFDQKTAESLNELVRKYYPKECGVTSKPEKPEERVTGTLVINYAEAPAGEGRNVIYAGERATIVGSGFDFKAPVYVRMISKTEDKVVAAYFNLNYVDFYVPRVEAGEYELFVQQKDLKSNGIKVKVISPSFSPITIVYPVSGAKLVQGEVSTIRWQTNNYNGNLSLHLVDFRAGPNYRLIASNVPAHLGQYEWRVPRDIVPGNEAFVVEIRGENDLVVKSGLFSISAQNAPVF